MANASTHVRIDPVLKEQASTLFTELGTDMSGAINMFLRQCVMRGGIPFAIEMPRYSQRTLDAMEEARRISRDPSIPSYHSIEAMRDAIYAEDDD